MNQAQTSVVSLVGGPLDGLFLEVKGAGPNELRLQLIRRPVFGAGLDPHAVVETSTAVYRRGKFRYLRGYWTFNYVANS